MSSTVRSSSSRIAKTHKASSTRNMRSWFASSATSGKKEEYCHSAKRQAEIDAHNKKVMREMF